MKLYATSFVTTEEKEKRWTKMSNAKAGEKSPAYLWGCDISLKSTGISIYDLRSKRFVYIGSFNTEKIYATKENKGLYLNGVKLRKVAEWIEALIEKYPPYYVAHERGFSRYNNETQNIFRCHGVVNYLLSQFPQDYYPPKKVKGAIVHGSASKEDVANAIMQVYDVEFENEDESDSCAVVLTCLIEKGVIEWHKPSWASIKKLRKPVEDKK